MRKFKCYLVEWRTSLLKPNLGAKLVCSPLVNSKIRAYSLNYENCKKFNLKDYLWEKLPYDTLLLLNKI